MESNSKIEVFPVIVPVSSGLRTVNFYLVKQEKSLTLIDAGFNTEECWAALINTLKENEFTLRDITEILLTHHHHDHIGIVDRVATKYDIPVYAHPNALPRLKRDSDFLQMRLEFFENLYEEMGCGERGAKQVTYLRQAMIQNKDNKIHTDIQEIADDQILNFEVLEMFGHAPDQVAFYHKEQKWLFGGDLLIEHIASNALVEPDFQGKRMKTLIQHRESLTNSLSLHAELFFSGHGITIKNPNQLIQKRIDGMDKKADLFMNYIQLGISTANEIAQLHYQQKYEKEFSLVMSVIIGHLDYLEEQRKIKKEWDRGVWHYFIK